MDHETNAASTTGAVLDRTMYLPPWRERNADGTLGREYGPPSASALARQTQRQSDWSFRPEKTPSKESKLNTEAMRALLASDTHIPDKERLVGRLMFCDGHSARWVARHLGIKRESVRVMLKRLRKRLDTPTQGKAE